jgi:hypothetical protein
LRAGLGDIEAQFEKLTATELPAVNKSLRSKGAQTLAVPPLTAFDDDALPGAGGGNVTGRSDPDAAHGIELPRNLRLWN